MGNTNPLAFLEMRPQPQSNTLSFGIPQQQTTPLMSPVVPTDAAGNALNMSFLDPAVDQANQFLLQEQGGLTRNSLDTAAPTNNMGASQWAGLGMGALNMGLGFLNNRADQKIAQGNLDLNRDKFAFLKENKAAISSNAQADIALAQKQMQNRGNV